MCHRRCSPHADRNDVRQRCLECRSWPRLHPHHAAQPAFADADRYHVQLQLTTKPRCPTGIRQHRPDDVGEPANAFTTLPPATSTLRSNGSNRHHNDCRHQSLASVVTERSGTRRAERLGVQPRRPVDRDVIRADSDAQNRRGILAAQRRRTGTPCWTAPWLLF